MSQLVCAGATVQCSLGAAPSVLNVLPANRTLTGGRPAANVLDSKPFVNIASFGLCMSLANPTVAAATAAALGALTPMPCAPLIPGPWVPGCPTVTVAGAPALNGTSACQCAYGGVVRVMLPGQFTCQLP